MKVTQSEGKKSNSNISCASQIEAVEELQATQQKMAEWENMMQLLQDDRDRLEAELAANERKETHAVHELDDLNSSLQVALCVTLEQIYG